MPSSENIYKPSQNAAFRNIGGQTVIVHTSEDRLITLNETGTAIWERLDGRTTKAIAQEIASLFEVSEGQALVDALDFLDYMKNRGLVEADPESNGE